MFNIAETNGLLIHGNSSTSGQTHGSSGQILDMADIMQILINQTNELTNLKKQAENDRSTIQLLQNRVFLLETELSGKMNASKTPSSQEFSTYLLSMIIQNMAANDENDKNLTRQFDIAVNHFEEYKAEMQFTLLNLTTELDHYKQQLESERWKVSLLQNLTQRTDKNFHDFKTDMLQMHVNQSTEMVGIKQQLERERSRVSLLENVTQTDEKVNDLITDLLQTRLNQTNEMVDYKQQLENEKSEVKQLNGSLLQHLEKRISDVHDQITASMNAKGLQFSEYMSILDKRKGLFWFCLGFIVPFAIISLTY